MRLYQMADPVRYATMTAAQLRETFLVDGLHQPGELSLIYADLDRTVLGMAVPTGKPLTLETHSELRAEYFLERRELGVLNIGGAGAITVDGTEYDKSRIVLYAYRHTYAQRHADAGVGIDVLRELMDHRKLDTTKGYYNPRELHQTGERNPFLRQLAV